MSLRFTAWCLAIAGLIGTASVAKAQLATDYRNLIQGTSSLQNYWSFEDLGSTGNLSTVADVEGGKNGTVIGTVESRPGLIGFSGYFPGDSDNSVINNVVEIQNSANDTTLALSGTSFTVEALVRTDSLAAQNWSGIVSKGDSAWRLARRSSSNYIQGGSNGLGGGLDNAFHALDNDIWHYIALRYDSVNNTRTVVFDDASVTTATDSADTLDTNAFDVLIGGNAQKPEREWLGYIDEVAIYNDALTDSQINNRVTLLDSDPGAIDAAKIAYWTGSQPAGTFASNAGWDANAPQPGDTVVIGKGGAITFDGLTTEVDNLEIGSTTDLIGNDSDGTATFNMVSGRLEVNGGSDMTVGRGTTGSITQSGGEIIFRGNDYELGEDANGNGSHTMTGGLLQIGDWVADPNYDGGFFMTNDEGGDDLSLGRERTSNPAETAVGVLTMSGNSEVRVSNDVFLDVGRGELYMSDNALMRVGDDFRASSADRGDSVIRMSGSSNIKVEGRFSIADSNDSVSDVEITDSSLIEVGEHLVIGGQDNLNESGDGVLTIEGNATINVGAFITRGDVGGTVATPNTTTKVADAHAMYLGAGNNGRGSGIVNQNGAGSTVTIGRQLNIGDEARGEYYLRGGDLIIRGDGPVSGTDFASGADGDSGFTSGGGDLIVGDEQTGVGLLSIEGGDLSVARDLIVGFDGTGRLRTQGSASTITVEGDLGFGGDFQTDAEGEGILDIVLTGSTHSVIDVVGGAEGGIVPGDLYLYDAAIDASLGGAYSIALGDYSSNPLEWKIISYAGSRNGTFDIPAGLADGSLNGIRWGLRYDDGNKDVYLQVLEVLEAVQAAPGDFNGDGIVDAADYTVWRDNLGQDASALNGNGTGGFTVGQADYSLWVANYGNDYSSNSNSAAVPEPTSIALLCLVAAAGAVANRRS